MWIFNAPYFQNIINKRCIFLVLCFEKLCSDLSWQIDVYLHWIDMFWKFVFGKVTSSYLGSKSPFARKTFSRKRLWKSRCYKCKICTAVCLLQPIASLEHVMLLFLRVRIGLELVLSQVGPLVPNQRFLGSVNFLQGVRECDVKR